MGDAESTIRFRYRDNAIAPLGRDGVFRRLAISYQLTHCFFRLSRAELLVAERGARVLK